SGRHQKHKKGSRNRNDGIVEGRKKVVPDKRTRKPEKCNGEEYESHPLLRRTHRSKVFKFEFRCGYLRGFISRKEKVSNHQHCHTQWQSEKHPLEEGNIDLIGFTDDACHDEIRRCAY